MKLIKRYFFRDTRSGGKAEQEPPVVPCCIVDYQKREVVIIESLRAYGVAEEAESGVSRSLSWPQAAEMSLPRDSRTSAV
jgi:hypothetical protein